MTDKVCTNIDQKLDVLHNKITKIGKHVTKESNTIRAHPSVFILMLIVFFITMDFFAKATHTSIEHFIPHRKLKYWEYTIVAVILLTLLLFIAHKSGIGIATVG